MEQMDLKAVGCSANIARLAPDCITTTGSSVIRLLTLWRQALPAPMIGITIIRSRPHATTQQTRTLDCVFNGALTGAGPTFTDSHVAGSSSHSGSSRASGGTLRRYEQKVLTRVILRAAWAGCPTRPHLWKRKLVK